MFHAIVACMFLSAPAQADNDAQLLYAFAASDDRAAFTTTLDRANNEVDALPLGRVRNRLRRAIIVSSDLDRVWQFDGLYWSEEVLPDCFDRLALEYSDFEAYISAYRVIDPHGRVLYPKQETRDFLLKKLKPSNSPKRIP